MSSSEAWLGMDNNVPGDRSSESGKHDAVFPVIKHREKDNDGFGRTDRVKKWNAEGTLHTA